MKIDYLMGMRFSLGEVKTFLELGRGDGCAMGRMYVFNG